MKFTKRNIFISLLPLLLNHILCSNKTVDVSGIYVHYRNLLKYYTLTIKKIDTNMYELKFEGVPLENYNTTEWSYKCFGMLSSGRINCGNFDLNFSFNYNTVQVSYSENERQTFIHHNRDTEENLTIYNKTGNQGKDK